MHRLILDTNVLVSSLIQKNHPYLILRHCIQGKAVICLSSPVFQEYLQVLARPKFARFPDFRSSAEFVLARISQDAEFFEPSFHVIVIADGPDNRFLELAKVSKADFLITGNHNDFVMKEFEKTKILSPKNHRL